MGQSYSYNGGQTFTYDALGKQVTSNWDGLQQNYDDGDGLRAKKVMNGVATYYLRSSVLGGQVVSEIDASGLWTRGYVYLGLQLVAVQYAGVIWVHQDPVSKGQRLVNINGTLESTIELDPFGGDTNRSVNASFQPRHFTTYERDTVGGMDEAMARRYHGWWSRFSQPDPYDGAYSLVDPQSFNRYSYVQSDPVNFVDPSGLDGECVDVDGNIVDCGPDVIDDKVVTNIWDWWGPLWDFYWGRHDYIPLILPVLNDGSRPVVELIPIPQNPTPTPTPPHQLSLHQDECTTYLANGRKDLYLICRSFYSTFGNGQRINRYSDCLQTHFGRSRSGRIGVYNGPTLPASQALGGAVLPLEALYGPTLHTTCLGSLF